MKTRRAWSIALAATGVVVVTGFLLAVAGAPRIVELARRIDALQVRRVEITGTRLLSPHEVLRSSGVRIGQHMLDDAAIWEGTLRDHPVIAAARVARRFPGTLRIQIEEEIPVAFLSDDTLRFATAEGRLLPVDPYVVPLDLPIVHGTLSDSASAAMTRDLLAEAQRLALVDPMFLREISDIRIAPNDRNALILHHPTAEIVVPFGVSAARLDQLRRVLADVERRFPEVREEAGRKHLVDLRFDDQVVVRPSSPPELS